MKPQKTITSNTRKNNVLALLPAKIDKEIAVMIVLPISNRKNNATAMGSTVVITDIIISPLNTFDTSVSVS
ncbi:MAG: hypothetical protein WC536_01370 [Patescibacteria group bacterium]